MELDKKKYSAPLEGFIEEDYQAWEAYKHNDNYRWLFNKLEIALRQELRAGPAATAPERSGWYVHRPISLQAHLQSLRNGYRGKEVLV